MRTIRSYPNKSEVEDRLQFYSELNFGNHEFDELPTEKISALREITEEWFGIEQAAQATGNSIRTIMRRIEDGSVSPVEIMGVSFLPKGEILKLIR